MLPQGAVYWNSEMEILTIAVNVTKLTKEEIIELYTNIQEVVKKVQEE